MGEPRPNRSGPAAETRLQLLDVEEVASLLRVSVRSVWAWSASGKIPPSVRIGYRAVRWRRSDIEEWISGLAERR